MAPPAEAAVLKRCGPNPRVLCGTVTVPLARDGAVPGRVRLAVTLVRATGRRHGTVLILPGGPGQAATAIAPSFAAPRSSPLGPLVRTRDLLFIDQRGTGLSGALRCPLLEITLASNPAPEITSCARHLGPAREYFQTRDTVDDIDAVRAALGIPRMAVLGVSYGTKVGLDYARRHPGRVSRLVLDSVVVPDSTDPFELDSWRALPRVIRALCPGACRSINPDPLGDLVQIVARLRNGPLLGYYVGLDGRRHVTHLTRPDLVGTIASGDLGLTPIYPELPAALRSARNGDTAPLIRLLRVAIALNRSFAPDPRAFSTGLNFATRCAEAPQPWPPGTPPGGARRDAARARAVALGDAAFFPFDVATATEGYQCLHWPSIRRPPEPPPGPLPAMPTLILNGTLDIRTPLEGARSLAARLPRARLVAVGGVAHSPFSADLTNCSARAVQRFLAGRPPGACPRRQPLVEPTPVAPTSLDQVRPIPGLPPKVGRTACAVGMTIRDAGVQLLAATPRPGPNTVTLRAPGLRIGTALARVRIRPTPKADMHLDHFSYVPGVVLTGTVREGPLRVSGLPAARGVVRVTRGGILDGRLGGRPVHANVRPCVRGGLGLSILVSLPGDSLANALARPRMP
jgi:pimeloyl-ACP methyl ester carboxylesterase